MLDHSCSTGPQNILGETLLADGRTYKSVTLYDADWFPEALTDPETTFRILERKSAAKTLKYDKGPNRIESMFGRLVDWRRISARYYRCHKVLLPEIALAAVVIFLL